MAIPETEISVNDPVLNERPAHSWLPERLGRRIAAGAFMLASAAGVGAAIEGYDPHPAVSSAGSEALIEANNLIREIGPWALGAGALAIGGGAALRRKNSKLDAEMRITNRYKVARMANLGLSVVLVGTTAAGSALGEAAASGANKPVELLAEATGANNLTSTLFLTQEKHALPFDHSQVRASDVSAIAPSIIAEGGTVVPYSIFLGDLRRPGASSNPSSSSVVLLPQRAIQREFGVSLPDRAGDNCDNNEIIVNKQLGAKPDETVLLENKPVKVAKTIDAYPGLDRAVAIGSLEEMQGCITSKDLYSGAAIAGLSEAQTEQLLKNHGFDYSVRTYGEYRDDYANFWSRSVKPPEMQLVMYVWLASIAGLGFMKLSDVLMRRQSIAALHSEGVRKSTLARAEILRAGTESVKAAYYGAVPTLGFIALNASSQYGISESFDLKALGAGFVTALSANLIGGAASGAFIGKMKTTAVDRE